MQLSFLRFSSLFAKWQRRKVNITKVVSAGQSISSRQFMSAEQFVNSDQSVSQGEFIKAKRQEQQFVTIPLKETYRDTQLSAEFFALTNCSSIATPANFSLPFVSLPFFPLPTAIFREQGKTKSNISCSNNTSSRSCFTSYFSAYSSLTAKESLSIQESAVQPQGLSKLQPFTLLSRLTAKWRKLVALTMGCLSGLTLSLTAYADHDKSRHTGLDFGLNSAKYQYFVDFHNTFIYKPSLIKEMEIITKSYGPLAIQDYIKVKGKEDDRLSNSELGFRLVDTLEKEIAAIYNASRSRVDVDNKYFFYNFYHLLIKPLFTYCDMEQLKLALAKPTAINKQQLYNCRVIGESILVPLTALSVMVEDGLFGVDEKGKSYGLADLYNTIIVRAIYLYGELTDEQRQRIFNGYHAGILADRMHIFPFSKHEDLYASLALHTLTLLKSYDRTPYSSKYELSKSNKAVILAQANSQTPILYLNNDLMLLQLNSLYLRTAGANHLQHLENFTTKFKQAQTTHNYSNLTYQDIYEAVYIYLGGNLTISYDDPTHHSDVPVDLSRTTTYVNWIQSLCEFVNKQDLTKLNNLQYSVNFCQQYVLVGQVISKLTNNHQTDLEKVLYTQAALNDLPQGTRLRMETFLEANPAYQASLKELFGDNLGVKLASLFANEVSDYSSTVLKGFDNIDPKRERDLPLLEDTDPRRFNPRGKPQGQPPHDQPHDYPPRNSR